jgi:hypothetical protein
VIWLLLAQFWVSVPDPTAVLQGNWQSCMLEDGTFAERIYDECKGLDCEFEFHMGPLDEFALFKGTHVEHKEHTDRENLLQPFRLGMMRQAQQTWLIPELNLKVEAIKAGGSRDECESWWVVLRRVKQ